MIVRPYETYDEERLCFDTSQEYMGEYLSKMDFDLAPLAEQNLVWTGEHNDKVVAMGGIAPIWPGRGMAWMWMSDVSGRHMVKIHREVEKFLIKSPFRRVEATVDIGFEPGVRWMKMLGFELEGYLRAYKPDGGDMLMFARVRR
jgi:hypothetical protein